jgi:hypothetical protein
MAGCDEGNPVNDADLYLFLHLVWCSPSKLTVVGS